MANKLAKLEAHPMGQHQSLTLLMMLCYTCRQEPTMAVLGVWLNVDWLNFSCGTLSILENSLKMSLQPDKTLLVIPFCTIPL